MEAGPDVPHIANNRRGGTRPKLGCFFPSSRLLFAFYRSLTLSKRKRILHILREFLKRATVARASWFCRLKRDFLLHRRLHLRFWRSCGNRDILAIDKSVLVESTNFFCSLRERFLLLKLLSLLKLSHRFLLWPVKVVRHMLNLFIEKASLSNFSLFRVPSVKVFRLQLDFPISIAVVFLNFHSVAHMFKGRLVDFFWNGFCGLKGLFM